MTMKRNSDGGANGFLENRRGINPLGLEARQKGIRLEGASEHRSPGPGKREPQRGRPGFFDQTEEGLERKLSLLIQTAREAGIKVTIRDRAS